jgi:hypothetical protein
LSDGTHGTHRRILRVVSTSETDASTVSSYPPKYQKAVFYDRSRAGTRAACVYSKILAREGLLQALRDIPTRIEAHVGARDEAELLRQKLSACETVGAAKSILKVFDAN